MTPNCVGKRDGTALNYNIEIKCVKYYNSDMKIEIENCNWLKNLNCICDNYGMNFAHLRFNPTVVEGYNRAETWL